MTSPSSARAERIGLRVLVGEAGWSVCLIEKKQFPREKTCGDGLTRGRSTN